MYVSRLALVNFRNYPEAEIDLPPGLLLFQGLNAQGKSNLLEAVYYLATSRSPRAQTDADLIGPHGRDPVQGVTRVSARIRGRSNETNIEVVLALPPSGPGTSRAVRKQIRVNGVPRRSVDLLGTFRVSLFRPEDLDLAAGPPSGRRRALDIVLAQIDREYARALQRYNRVLLQRNHLLRQIGEGHASQADLSLWDEPMAELGCFLLRARKVAVDEMSRLSSEIYRRLSGEREQMASAYVSTAGGVETFRAALQAAARKDIALGQTTVGPHRDDVSFTIDGRPASTFGSRGQQRAVVLSWKLAEGAYLRLQTGEDPVLLWDDVLSELDHQRRRAVVDLAGQYEQVFLTTTGVELAELHLRPAASYSVEHGRLTLGASAR